MALAAFVTVSCSNGDDPATDGHGNLPIGSYSSPEHYIAFRSDGTFTLENFANVNDNRNFAFEGTYSYTRDVIDPNNNSYGKVTMVAKKFYLNDIETNSLYLDDGLSAGSYTQLDDVLEGWWAYSDNITYVGKMRVYFNWPNIPRGTNYYDGHNELFRGDP